jgi:hypothetical protein
MCCAVGPHPGCPWLSGPAQPGHRPLTKADHHPRRKALRPKQRH